MRNIYLIEARDEANIDYDCYDGHVVIESTPKLARKRCPSGDEGKTVWLDPKLSKVTKIGETNRKAGVVLSSFNAG